MSIANCRSEIRRCPLTGRWTILAPHRAKRPSDHDAPSHEKNAVPTLDPDCPFCPGNEAMLPKILDETGAVGRSPWQCRAVPNKYPAVCPGSAETAAQRESSAISGIGRHEVIIDHPRHNHSLQEMTDDEIRAVAHMYLRRYRAAVTAPGGLRAVLFRNCGSLAGTSLVHPHSQLLAIPIEPPLLKAIREHSVRHYHRRGTCLLCELLDFQGQNKELLIHCGEHFALLAASAPEAPGEMWLVPRRHAGDLLGIGDGELTGFAQALRAALRVLDKVYDTPDSNLVIHSHGPQAAGEPGLHWLARITPRTTGRAGFEIGSGMHICTSLPEEDAASLRLGFTP